ncbi:hypothetical protein [Nonomuraea africana]|uniref:DUF1772 domain-containing protein n=1 Tax=Nonomuraea africana TaxID=46171 RepID=A0ABR9KVG5_9ACTN|nr:hypothetical protein [Nonomuraea africana]MBE1565990.1 hypothetical protein [Nonomuraea africana]
MITLAAVLQILIALAFVSIPLVRARYGAGALAATEAELDRQNIPRSVLAENNIRFDASGHETWAPLSIAVLVTALAVLNLTGSWGETLSWVLQPLVLLVNLFILYSNLTAERSVRAHFAKTGDPVLQRIDVKAMLGAAERAFPSWVLPGLQNLRHVIVMGGSVAALVLLAIS